VEFLVHIDIHLPAKMPAELRADLLAREAARGRELLADGTLVRIWRVPGRLANVSLYRAADAAAVHAAITSLPMWPWMDVRVDPLAVHPLEQGASDSEAG
jgi:muconolactone D-isomerase